MFGLYSLLMTFILFVNSIAILSEDRFLNRIGLGLSSATSDSNSGVYNGGASATGYGLGGAGNSGNMDTSVKSQIMKFIHAIRTVARVPLIVINLLTVVCLLIWG